MYRLPLSHLPTCLQVRTHILPFLRLLQIIITIPSIQSILYKGISPAIILCPELSIFPFLLDYSIYHTNLQVLLSYNFFNFLLTSLLSSSYYCFSFLLFTAKLLEMVLRYFQFLLSHFLVNTSGFSSCVTETLFKVTSDPNTTHSSFYPCFHMFQVSFALIFSLQSQNVGKP